MSEKSNNEWFVKTVEETANVAISEGRDVNEVIHDTIEVIYGRKNINELVPSGWVVITNRCQECAYERLPAVGSSPCFRCYNHFFYKFDLNVGPYTDNFKPKAEKEDSDAPRHWCADCEYYNTSASHYPCRNCFYKDEKPYFRPIEGGENNG